MIDGKAGFIGWLGTSPWPVGAVLLTLALAVRLPQLTELPDLDERATLTNHIRQPVSAIVRIFGNAQNHPLYSVLAHFVWLVRPTLVASRIPALLAGLAAVLALWFWLRQEAGPLPAAWAAVALAVSPPQILYSARARGYSMLVLGSIAASWLLQRALRKDRFRDWTAYGAAIVLTAYAHLWGLFVLVGHGVFLATAAAERPSPRTHGGRPDISNLRILLRFAQVALACMGLIGLLYAPMARGILSMLIQGRQTAIWTDFGRALAWNWDFGLPEANLAVGVFGGALVTLALTDGTLCRDPLCRLGGLPIAATLILVALVQPANFYPRFLIFLVPFALILLAGMLRRLPRLDGERAGRRPWALRPPGLSNALAGLAAVLLAISVTLLGIGRWAGAWEIARQWYGGFAWLALASGVLAWLCGGVRGQQGGSVSRLMLAATVGLVFIDVASAMIDLDWLGAGIGRATWSALALAAGLILIVWTAVVARTAESKTDRTGRKEP